MGGVVASFPFQLGLGTLHRESLQCRVGEWAQRLSCTCRVTGCGCLFLAMAQRLQIQGRFGYRRVQLVKSRDNSLGIGSYGAVYKAKCDQLPCAAKVLHPILFETRDPASQRIVQRFEQECQFLSEMRHPNVIQYLGTCRDPESGLPVLFMELMDASLTSFLERSDAPLPFHTQVNIACDIAQALAYLHSHEVIHRDLSSNNVLLIGNSRAKVTDFGMSKLSDAGHLTTPRPLTQLPGTEVYMPPEAFLEPPEYSNRLDCFSLGVLGVQIITRKFPKPRPRRRQIRVPRTRQAPTGRAEVLVREVDRRNAHIALIDGTHQLLRVSLDCLKDEDKDRPTADQLCSRLSTLKQSQRYQESVGHSEASAALREQVHRLQQELEQVTERAEASKQLVADFQQSIERKDREHHEALRAKDEERDAALRARDEVLMAKDEAVRQKERQIHDLQQEVRQGRHMVREPVRLQWKDGPNSPVETYGESAAVHGKMAYFCDSYSGTKVLQYNSETGEWSILDCPKKCFSLAAVNGLLTAIGGKQSGEATKTLLSLTGQQTWTKQFPPMAYHHNCPAVACTSTSLIVAGGWGPDVEMAPVEVMDTKTLCWSTAASLPHRWHQATVTICGDRMYVAGGFGKGSTRTQSVLTCVVSDLLQSAVSQNQSLGSRLATALRVRPSPESCTVWQEVAELPVYRSTLVTLQGQLLAVGGCDSDLNSTSAVYQYDTATNSWKIISHMNTKRRQCMAVVLPGDRLMVVGGYVIGGGTTPVEIASLV